jgi:serine/threonine protein kinase
VAVKVLSLKQLPRSMVEQEITAMRRCGQHPNVVALLDVVWVQPDNINPYGEAVLVMELAAGGGLFERLVEEGYNPSYGARPLRRAVMRLLEDSLAEEFLSGRIGDGDAALVDVDDSKQVVIRKQLSAAALPELAAAGA